MATLVLTAVGTLVGGPIGGAIGALAGGAIDRGVLFRPAAREGPRLTELALQTSTYGAPLPKLFGTIRVAGCVIWATDLVEHRATESHGKMQPRTTTYSYSASFAVALSARPVRGVHRIWADGKLLRGAAGDFKSALGAFRLHSGDEDQPVDPLIAAAEGAAPAHRGLAYAVFEDLALGDFGNRIPSLTFEVEADAEPVDAGAIAAALAPGSVAVEGPGLMLGGFSAYGSDLRSVIAPLADAAGLWARAEPGRLVLVGGAGAAVALPDPGCAPEGKPGRRGARSIAAADTAPRTVAVAYYDAARDYQSGVQRALRPGAGQRETRVELPAVLGADAAKTLAEAMLSRAECARERRSVALDWSRMHVAPGARVAIAGTSGLWRVERWSLAGMVLTLECVKLAPATAAATGASGRVSPAPDLVAGASRLIAAELPPLDEALASTPRLTVLAAGTGAGWRRAALSLSIDGGASWRAGGASALPAVLGTLVDPPGAGPATIEDRRNTLVVALAHDAMQLHDAGAAALDAGANLALVGDELLQFGGAEPLGGALWRLSRLWRGRRGTESAIGTQAPGDRFAVLGAASAVLLDVPSGLIGASVQVMATAIADSATAVASLTGRSVVPPAPVRLRAESAAGGTALRWTRRSRAGWRWIDGVDAPLAEESERYRIAIAPTGGAAWTVETSEPTLLLGDAERAVPLAVSVRQIGSNGLSPPATLALPALA